MRVLPITSCRSCSSKSLEKIISLGRLYLSDFVSDHKKPEKFPLSLILCNTCSLVQLQHTAPQHLLYSENYGYRSGINSTMKKELNEIVNKSLKEHKGEKGKLLAVDIGANDGTLLSNYPSHIETVGIEPIRKLAKDCKKHATHIINDFFNYKSYRKVLKDRKADIITVISCFYDMEEPNTFVDDITKILNQDGVLIIQQNYLVSMLKLNAFDNIVHEHLEYYSLLSLTHLLERHNLEVFHVEENDLNGGSFRTYITFKGLRKINDSVHEMVQKENLLGLDKKNIYNKFAKRIEKNKLRVYEFIKKQHAKGKKVYVYGASTRGNTLLQYYQLDRTLIPFAVERNPEKWGKFIASVGIPIISEEQARIDKPDYLLVLPWFFKNEFISREKHYLDSGGHFIFPLPSMSKA